MKAIDTKRQALRRKTLFPLNSREVFQRRKEIALELFQSGHKYNAIRQILNLSGPDKARALVARGVRELRELNGI
jgi:hypothetical protein